MPGTSTIASLLLRFKTYHAALWCIICRDEVPEFIDHLPHSKAGICITDPLDPRHIFITELRARTGAILHRSVNVLKNNGAEDSIDSVKMVIGCVKVLELDYPCDHMHHGAIKKSYEFALQISKTTRNQKLFPRLVARFLPCCEYIRDWFKSFLRIDSFGLDGLVCIMLRDWD